MIRAPLHFVAAFSVLVAVGVGYVLWYGTVSAQSVRVADLQAQITAKKSSLVRAASIRAALGSLSNEEAATRQYFVSENTLVSFISSLQRQGQQLGGLVTVKSVSADTHGARPTLTLALTVDGTFDSVLRTVGAIEYAPYDIQVTGLSLQNQGKNAWEAALSITVGSVAGGVSGSAPAVQTTTPSPSSHSNAPSVSAQPK